MNLPTRQPAVYPIGQLTEDDGYVLIITRAPGLETYLNTRIGRLAPNGIIEDNAGQDIRVEHNEITLGWTPAPYTEDDVRDALRRQEDIDKGPTLKGNPDDHIKFTQHIVCEFADTANAQRVMARLHTRLGNDIDGPRLPESTDPKLTYIRSIITHWAVEAMTANAAVGNLQDFLD